MSKSINPDAVKVIEACRDLQFDIGDLSGGILIEIPTKKDFLKKIDADDWYALECYDLIVDYITSVFHKKVNTGRFHIWQTGTIRIDSSKNEHLWR